MEEYKEALLWNYGKGIDSETAADMTASILKEMERQGRAIDENAVKSVLETVMTMKPSEDQKARFEEIHHMIDEVPKFGNDIPEVDYFARDVAYTYTRPLQNYKNPRGGQFQAGLYPVSANVPLGGRREPRRTDAMPTLLWQTAYRLRQERM